MKYTYLLLNFFTMFFPVLLSFDKGVQFYKSWKFTLPGIVITGFVFLFWDVLFTLKGVWSFNEKYIIGIKFFGLPLEEILFFLTVPFACIFTYACINYYVKPNINQKITKLITGLLTLFSLVLIVIYYNKLYTLVTFSLLAVLFLLLRYVFKVNWLNRFYKGYMVSLIPFYIVNGILTALPVVLYNNAENMHIRIGTIPFEDHFYCMALLLMNVGIFEFVKTKNKPTP